MPDIEKQKQLIKQIIKQLSGDVDENIELVPEHGIKGQGHMFCFQPATKSFIKIYKNQNVYILDELKNKKKYLIYTTCGKIVEINSEKIYKMDFN